MNRILSLFNKTTVLVLCALALAPCMVQAEQSQAFDRSDPMAIYKEAGVNQEQQQKIRELAKEFESGARVKAERVSNLMKRMHELALQADPDEKAVLATQDDINNVQTEMGNTRIRLMLNIRGLLAANQKVRLVELMKQRRAMNPGNPSPTQMDIHN